MTARVLVLEPFDKDPVDAIIPCDPSRLPGYEVGFNAGQAASQKMQAELSEGMAEKFIEMAFGYAEARSHILASLDSLIDAIVQKILPETASDLLRAQLISLIETAAITDAQHPITILAAASEIDVLKASLPSSLSMPLQFETDQSLHPSQVVLRRSRAETSLDADAFIAEIQTVLRSCQTTDQEDVRHG